MAVKRAKKAKKSKKAVKKKAKAKVKVANAKVMLNIQSSGLPKSKRKLPSGTVRLRGKDALVVNVQKLSRALIRDQRARLVSSMGCISNPGGPSC